MKTICFFFMSFLVVVSCTNTRNVSSTKSEKTESYEQRIDTAALIKNILAEKGKYLNKEVGVLLGDLKPPIQSYSVINHNLSEIDGIMVSFYDKNTLNRKLMDDPTPNRYLVLQVYFKTPIPMQVYKDFVNKNPNDTGFGNAEKEFYSKYIIKEINSD